MVLTTQALPEGQQTDCLVFASSVQVQPGVGLPLQLVTLSMFGQHVGGLPKYPAAAAAQQCSSGQSMQCFWPDVSSVQHSPLTEATKAIAMTDSFIFALCNLLHNRRSAYWWGITTTCHGANRQTGKDPVVVSQSEKTLGYRDLDDVLVHAAGRGSPPADAKERGSIAPPAALGRAATRPRVTGVPHQRRSRVPRRRS